MKRLETGYQILKLDSFRKSLELRIAFDEGRRGVWLNPLDGNAYAQKALKQNEWNPLRIESL